MSAKHMRKVLRAFLMSCKEDYKMYLLLSYCGNILHRVLSTSDLALVNMKSQLFHPVIVTQNKRKRALTIRRFIHLICLKNAINMPNKEILMKTLIACHITRCYFR